MNQILLVEDNDGIRQVIKLVLEREGYIVSAKKNGKDAWEYFEENGNQIDYVITDWDMPKMRGEELIGKIRDLDTDIFIISIPGVDSNAEASCSVADKYLFEYIKLNEEIDVAVFSKEDLMGSDCVLRKPIFPRKLIYILKYKN